MPKYAIAFVAPAGTHPVKHAVIEDTDRDSALKKFFAQELNEFYSNDEQGYFYFKEDFFDRTLRSGSVIQLD